MMTLEEYLEKQINEYLKQAVLSGNRKEGVGTVKIRPVKIREQIFYQASAMEGTKVLHKNYDREQVIAYIKEALGSGFGQLQAQGQELDGTVLVSKKGKITVKAKRHPGAEKIQIQAHNRVKNIYLRKEHQFRFWWIWE